MVYDYGPPVEHYGIKGQKWGIRRTPEQLGHTKSTRSRKSSSATLKTTKKSKSKKSSVGIIKKLKEKRQARKDARIAEEKRKAQETIDAKKERIVKSRSAKQLYENADLFTTQELQTAYNRLNLERNIANLAASEKSAGRRYVDGYINTARKVGDVLQSTNKAMTQGKAFVKFFSGNASAAKKNNDGNPNKQNNSGGIPNINMGSSKKKSRNSSPADDLRKEARSVVDDLMKDMSRDFSDLPKALPGIIESGQDWYDQQGRRRRW